MIILSDELYVFRSFVMTWTLFWGYRNTRKKGSTLFFHIVFLSDVVLTVCDCWICKQDYCWVLSMNLTCLLWEKVCTFGDLDQVCKSLSDLRVMAISGTLKWQFIFFSIFLYVIDHTICECYREMDKVVSWVKKSQNNTCCVHCLSNVTLMGLPFSREVIIPGLVLSPFSLAFQ